MSFEPAVFKKAPVWGARRRQKKVKSKSCRVWLRTESDHEETKRHGKISKDFFFCVYGASFDETLNECLLFFVEFFSFLVYNFQHKHSTTYLSNAIRCLIITTCPGFPPEEKSHRESRYQLTCKMPIISRRDIATSNCADISCSSWRWNLSKEL